MLQASKIREHGERIAWLVILSVDWIDAIYELRHAPINLNSDVVVAVDMTRNPYRISKVCIQLVSTERPKGLIKRKCLWKVTINDQN